MSLWCGATGGAAAAAAGRLGVRRVQTQRRPLPPMLVLLVLVFAMRVVLEISRVPRGVLRLLGTSGRRMEGLLLRGCSIARVGLVFSAGPCRGPAWLLLALRRGPYRGQAASAVTQGVRGVVVVVVQTVRGRRPGD